MNALHRLVVRDGPNPKDDSLDSTIARLSIALVVLVVLVGILVVGLFVIRSRRRAAKKNASLPMYNETSSSNPRRLTVITASYGRKHQSDHVYDEKQNLVENSFAPPSSPSSIPEIRVTFPEEQDESGRRRSGGVVIVRVGETGLGLEPLVEESLPPYQRSEVERFHSIDLERIGGLKER